MTSCARSLTHPQQYTVIMVLGHPFWAAVPLAFLGSAPAKLARVPGRARPSHLRCACAWLGLPLPVAHLQPHMYGTCPIRSAEDRPETLATMNSLHTIRMPFAQAVATPSSWRYGRAYAHAAKLPLKHALSKLPSSAAHACHTYHIMLHQSLLLIPLALQRAIP